MRKYNIVLVLFLSAIVGAQDCNDRVEIVFNKLVQSIGNYSMLQPDFNIVKQERNAAKMDKYGVTIEQKAIDLFCGDYDFDDKISYILAHELAHYYNKHTWMRNTGLGYASSVQETLDSIYYTKSKRKESEIQADLYAGFYGQIAGYNTLEKAAETLSDIYDEYDFPRENPKYPSFKERVEIINSKIKIANDLALLFEIGNILLLNKSYKESRNSYMEILRYEFNSREIHNNLGLTYLLQSIKLFPEPINRLIFPVSLEQKTRAEVSLNRSGEIEKTKTLLKKANEEFEWSLRLDPNYSKAINNAAIAKFLLIESSIERETFIKNIDNDDPEFIIDMEVINMILENKKIKKIKKIAEKGSEISYLNTQKQIINNPINQDNLLRKLELSPSSLRRGRGKWLLDSDFQVISVGEIKIIKNLEYDIAIINVPKSTIESSLFSKDEVRQLINTQKGNYLIYKLK